MPGGKNIALFVWGAGIHRNVLILIVTDEKNGTLNRMHMEVL